MELKPELLALTILRCAADGHRVLSVHLERDALDGAFRACMAAHDPRKLGRAEFVLDDLVIRFQSSKGVIRFHNAEGSRFAVRQCTEPIGKFAEKLFSSQQVLCLLAVGERLLFVTNPLALSPQQAGILELKKCDGRSPEQRETMRFKIVGDFWERIS